MKTAGPALAVLLLGACSCGPPPPLQVISVSAQAWTQDPAALERARVIAEDAVRWWGGSPNDLQGWELRIQDGPVHCGDLGDRSGCCFNVSRQIVVSADFAFCVDGLPIPHEIGHVLVHDGSHADPRWYAAITYTDGLATSMMAGGGDSLRCP